MKRNRIRREIVMQLDLSCNEWYVTKYRELYIQGAAPKSGITTDEAEEIHVFFTGISEVLQITTR